MRVGRTGCIWTDRESRCVSSALSSSTSQQPSSSMSSMTSSMTSETRHPGGDRSPCQPVTSSEPARTTLYPANLRLSAVRPDGRAELLVVTELARAAASAAARRLAWRHRYDSALQMVRGLVILSNTIIRCRVPSGTRGTTPLCHARRRTIRWCSCVCQA